MIDPYTACGCGCCGGRTTTIAFTLHPQEIIKEDTSISLSDTECALVGCFYGKR